MFSQQRRNPYVQSPVSPPPISISAHDWLFDGRKKVSGLCSFFPLPRANLPARLAPSYTLGQTSEQLSLPRLIPPLRAPLLPSYPIGARVGIQTRTPPYRSVLSSIPRQRARASPSHKRPGSISMNRPPPKSRPTLGLGRVNTVGLENRTAEPQKARTEREHDPTSSGPLLSAPFPIGAHPATRGPQPVCLARQAVRLAPRPGGATQMYQLPRTQDARRLRCQVLGVSRAAEGPSL